MTDDVTDEILTPESTEAAPEIPLSERIEAILFIVDEPIGLVALAAAVGAPCTIAILLDLPLQASTTAVVVRSPMSTQSAPTNTVEGWAELMLICTT